MIARVVVTLEGQPAPPPALADQRGQSFDHEMALRPIIEELHEPGPGAGGRAQRPFERFVAPAELAPARTEDRQKVRCAKGRLHQDIVEMGLLDLGVGQ